MQLLKESEKYVERQIPGRSDRQRGLRLGADTGYGSLADIPKEPVRDITYLTKPILNAAGIRAATKEADDMEKRGQKSLAHQIRMRIKDACSQQLGVNVSSQKLVCVSAAEELRQRAWSCEVSDAYPMAEKLYNRVLQIYQQEIGSTRRVANTMGDLARVYCEEKQFDKAKGAYSQALVIYDKHPDLVDCEMASFLESYAQFMEQHGTQKAADDLYKRAAAVRKTGSSRKFFW